MHRGWGGRDIANNLSGIDASILAIAAEAEDEDSRLRIPLLVSLDIRAAFPSLLPGWMTGA